MKNLLKGKAGFTMVELMVVVIIVGILAAVAIPLYQANIKRAILTEAQATLGSIRTAERIYKAEFNVYTSATGAEISSMLGVNVVDAHYFDQDCYSVSPATATTYTATCINRSGNTAPGAAQADKYFPFGATAIATMNEGGVMTP